jgi:hypothetical protein
MINKIITLILFFLSVSSITYCQIGWQVTLSLYKDDYGNVMNKDEFVIKSIISTDTAMCLIFDYDEILKDVTLEKFCSSDFESFKSLNQSLILIENDQGKFTTLSDNNMEGYRPSRGIQMSSKYDFDILGIDATLLRKWEIPYSFPLSKLFSCGKTSKVRFHYFYWHSTKFVKFRSDSFYMMSDWISITSIK